MTDLLLLDATALSEAIRTKCVFCAEFLPHRSMLDERQVWIDIARSPQSSLPRGLSPVAPTSRADASPSGPMGLSSN